MKRTAQSAFFDLRTLVALLVCGAAACSMLSGALLAFFGPEVPTKPSERTLTFAERVAYQRAIEEVYWRHRIWPKERTDPKPSLDAVMSQAQLEKKVADYLRNSQAVEDYWQRPITAEQLQAEMNRMAERTKQPDVLRELFEALGNDPFIIAECLARPALAERLLKHWYACDQRIHGELRQRAKDDLQAHSAIAQMQQLSGEYSEIEFVKSSSSHGDFNHNTSHAVKLNSREWDENMQKVAATFRSVNRLPMVPPVAAGASPAKGAPLTQITTGVQSPLQEDETRYFAVAVIEKTKDHLKLATVEWRKEPLESWRARAETNIREAIATPDPGYTLPKIEGAGCTDDTWTPTTGQPEGRVEHTSVWTGSEMIVWGGAGSDAFLD